MPGGLPRNSSLRISPDTGEVIADPPLRRYTAGQAIPAAISAIEIPDDDLREELESLLDREPPQPPFPRRRPRSRPLQPGFTKAWWDSEREGCFLVFTGGGHPSATYFTKYSSWYAVPEFNRFHYEPNLPPGIRGPDLNGLLSSTAYKYGFKDSDAFLNHLKTLHPSSMDLSKEVPEVVEPPVQDDTGKTLWDHLDED